MREFTREDARVSLDYLLAMVKSGNDKSGDAFRFLKRWHEGKSLENLEISNQSPMHVTLIIFALQSYIAGHDATVRPIAFGKHAEVARLINGG